MEKLLFVSFAPEPKKGINRATDFFAGRFFRVLLMALALNAADIKSNRADTPAPKPSLDPSFLLLPAYDLERVPTAQSPIQVGDPVHLKILAPPSEEWKIEVPPGIVLQDEGWAVRPEGPTGISVIPLKPGSLSLPSLGLKSSQDRWIGRTNPWLAEVRSAIKDNDPEPTQPADLEPPVGLKFPIWIVLALGTFGGFVLIGLGVGLVRWWKKRSPGPAKTSGIRLREDEIALKELTQLVNQALLSQGKFKVHYFRISEILKTYVGDRYHLDALESTTDEMMTLLKARKDTGDATRDALESLFEKLDRVKFTDHVPLPEESSSLMEDARKFVLTTRRPHRVAGIENSSPGENASPRVGVNDRAL